MANQYSPKHFFRKMPKVLLARYFESKGVTLAVDWDNLDGKKGVEALFEAITAIPDEEVQSAIDVDFQNINALANEGGIRALINEALFEGNEDFRDGVSEVDGLHAKAMWAFLHQPDYWKAASSLLHAENISQGNWKKLNGLPAVIPHVEDEDITELAKGISNYFYKKEGKGRRCKVEPYRHIESGKEYFFAFPEDYGQLGVEWEKDQLLARAQHPAFEIIFVYSEQERFLDIYAPKNTNAVEELRSIFAKAILKLDTLPDGTIDKRVYNLEPLADPHFDFKITEDSGIADAIVTKLRLKLKHGSMRRILLEADTKHNRHAVYDLLKTLNPPDYYITHIAIKVIFDPQPGKRANTKPFTITYPNSCNLNHDGKDNAIRNMLKGAGIEPQPPKDDNDA